MRGSLLHVGGMKTPLRWHLSRAQKEVRKQAMRVLKGRRIPGQGNSKCKGSEAKVCCPRNSQEASGRSWMRKKKEKTSWSQLIPGPAGQHEDTGVYCGWDRKIVEGLKQRGDRTRLISQCLNWQQTLGGGNGRRRETSYKTMAIIQARDHGGLEQHDNSKEVKSGHILDEFWKWCWANLMIDGIMKQEKKGRHQGCSKDFGLGNQRMESPFVKMGKTTGRRACGGQSNMVSVNSPHASKWTRYSGKWIYVSGVQGRGPGWVQTGESTTGWHLKPHEIPWAVSIDGQVSWHVLRLDQEDKGNQKKGYKGTTRRVWRARRVWCPGSCVKTEDQKEKSAGKDEKE